jgi:hypothetical protein
LNPSHPKFANKQSKVYFSLATIHLQNNDPKSALEAAQRSLHYDPRRIHSLIVQTKSLFLLKQFERGRQSLLSTLESNSCSDRMAIDVIEFCCDQLDLGGGVSAIEHDKRISIVKEAYGQMQKKYPTYEPTIVSQFRTMIRHRLYDLAIEHLDRCQGASNRAGDAVNKIGCALIH